MKRKNLFNGNGGSIIITAVIFAMILAIISAAFWKYVTNEVNAVRRQNNSLRAFFYAESGINYGTGKVTRGWGLSRYIAPFQFLDTQGIADFSESKTLLANQREEGTFDVEVLDITTPYDDAKDITLKSTGMYQGRTRTIVATYRLELEPSRVFDYAYFVNHWGWFDMGSGLKTFGNVRSNGYFTINGATATINGNPEYERILGEVVFKNSGGLFSSFRIDDGSTLGGMGGMDENQQQDEDLNSNGVLDDGEDHNQDEKLTEPEQLVMPNLNQQDLYEVLAKGWNGGTGSSIKIRGAAQDGSDLVVSDAVLGDVTSENDHLVIWGTEDNPIVIDGPVVVRGALIIKGYITGQGAIYSGHNIYIPDDLRYVNPPDGFPEWDYSNYATDEERDKAWQEISSEWIEENADKDGIGLFATENIVLADFKDNQWIGDVSSWLNKKENESAERTNGLDHIPNTSDQGEGDSTWTVDHFTDEDATYGLIPDGMSVGDVIPESGEDINGNAIMDDRININEFSFPVSSPLKERNWDGWVPIEWPKGGLNYGRFTNVNGPNYMNHVDGLLYTNNALVGSIGRDRDTFELYGGLVTRVEALVINTVDSSGTLTHDERFTGGGAAAFGFIFPKMKKVPQLVSWREVSADYQLP